MRQLYINKWSEKIGADHSKYILSDAVKAGQVLHVHNCYAHAPERAANEIVQIGVRNGVGDVLIRSRGAGIAAEGMSARRDFFVGEGDQIFAYFPSAQTTDLIELHVVGCLITLDDWRRTGW